jgi:hypothetical protein
MTELARRTIGELKARYDLEPSLRDVFVEGRFDQDILSNCLRGAEHHGRMIYDIDSVEVPTKLLTEHKLTDGNKQRVIALARELEQLPSECQYRCLVDRDLDHWLGPLETTARLVWTEYCSMELYFFMSELLRDIVITTAKSKINNWQEYLDSLVSTLRQMYALRLADSELSWSIEWLTVGRCLSSKESRIVFDNANYTDRLLKKNGKIKEKQKFLSAVDCWLDKLSGDPRTYIRGHDLIDLLAWTVAEFRGIKEFSSSISIQRLLVLLARGTPGLLKGIE